MKCIKNVTTGEIKKVDDSSASKSVDSKSWVYIPKSEWKSAVRDVNKKK